MMDDGWIHVLTSAKNQWLKHFVFKMMIRVRVGVEAFNWVSMGNRILA